ncbi:universal stress protein [Thermodesulfobacteriota bacterium]
MAQQKILLPYNFTQNDRKALNFVIRTFPKENGVAITLFNAYVPAPDIDLKGSPVMERIKGQMDQLAKKTYEQENALKEAKQNLLQSGFGKDRVHHIFEPVNKDIASDIIDQISKEKYDVVVLNRKPAKISRLFTRSIFMKVVSTIKDVTVCVVN